MNLATKIFLTILFLSLLVSIISGFLIYTLNRVQTEASIGQTQLNTTVITLDVIDRFFSERYGDIQVFTKIETGPEYLTNTSTTTDSKKLESLYSSLINIYGAWDAFIVLDTNGTVVISTDQDLAQVTLNPTTEEYVQFQNALQGGISYSDFFISELTNSPTVVFASPIRSPQKAGEIVGVGLGFVDWKVVEEILGSTKMDTYLFNANGTQIATGIQNDHPITHDKSHPALIKALEGQSGFERFNNSANALEMLASYGIEAGYFDYKGNGWVLLLEQPTGVVFANAERNAYIIIAFFALVGIFFAGLSITLFKAVFIEPIERLTQTTQKIAAGNLDERASIDSHDEVGELANVFNHMADSIRDSQQNLENKVKERTASLDQKIEQLDALNKHMVGREIRMAELKKENEMLKLHSSKTH
jgi:HAMP domain-containing protein